MSKGKGERPGAILGAEIGSAIYDIVRRAIHDELAEVDARTASSRGVAKVTGVGQGGVGTQWLTMESTQITGATGGRKYHVFEGDPVRVRGFGKRTAKNPEGAAQPGWSVVSITAREDDEDDVNVVVKKGNVTRTVKSTKLEYVRGGKAER